MKGMSKSKDIEENQDRKSVKMSMKTRKIGHYGMDDPIRKPLIPREYA